MTIELFVDMPFDGVSSRHDRAFAGCVISNGLLFPCRVTDCSDTEACCDFGRAIFIAGDVRLCVDAIEIDADCTIVWRRDTAIGIRFKDRQPVAGTFCAAQA